MTGSLHKTRICRTVICIACFFAVLIFVLPSPAVYATANDDAIAAAIYSQSAIQSTDDDWVKYVKTGFANETGITSATSGGAITWASVTSGGSVSAPWNGTQLVVTASLPTVHTPGITELVAATVTSGSIQTVTYTQYKPGASASDPDIAEIQLVVKTDTSTPDTAEYHPYTAEALAYAMGQFAADKRGAVCLEKDIDLNGQNYNWIKVTMNQGQLFDGQGHTIYNLCANHNEGGNSRSGFVCTADRGITFKNVNFDTAYIIGVRRSGVIGYMGATNGAHTLENVHVKNILTVISSTADDGQGGALAGRVASGSKITNCSAEDSVVFGGNHVGSLTAAVVGFPGSVVRQSEVTRCFTTGCTVFSTKSHSGGFVSCSGNTNFTDCFTDVSVYGSNKTGVFTGALNGTCNLQNCFASGFIEGKNMIGGFLGGAEYISGGTNLTLIDCYTTALVGLRTGGTQMGGFIGNTEDRAVNCTFENCYAAGEVGSADTDVSAPAGGDYTVDQQQQCGGFIGFQNNLGGHTYIDCYYDKQTTAMREWGVGHQPAGADRSGIMGVLSTATEKSGNGLLTQDLTQSSNGFQGFPGSASWDFSAEDHYPELLAFKNADATLWGSAEYANTAKAYSLSSTSGAQLETWDKGLDTDTGEFTSDLPDTTYCTVRDLTSGFLLTSQVGVLSTDGWIRTKTESGDGSEVAKSIIKGVEYDVLSLKHQNGQYLCDDLMPGIEWLTVTCEVNGTKATRRMRVIPTAAIEAGQSVVITSTYDHADDVELFFSTAPRLDDSITDVTTGIYPDGSPLTPRQTQLAGGVDMSTGDNTFRDVTVPYMSSGNDNAENGKLYMYVYPVTDFDNTTNEILYDPLMSFTAPVDALSPVLLGDALNELERFPNKDQRFLLSYAWVLNDGRVLQDAKLLRVAEVPFDLQLNLYKNELLPERLYPEGGYLYDGVNGTAKPTLTDFSSFETVATENSATLDADVDFKVHAQTAWKLKNPADSLKSVKLTSKISDTEFYEKEVLSPASGQTIVVPVTRYRIVYRNGTYFTIPEVVDRTYTLMQDTATDTWFLNFDMTDVPESGFILNDVETNIVVDVVVNSTAPDTGGLKVQKTVEGTGADFNKAFSFVVTLSDASINGAYGNMTFNAGVAQFTLKHGESMSAAGLPTGITYEVTESGSDGYSVTKTGDTGAITYNTEAVASFANRKDAPPTPPTTGTPTSGTTSSGGPHTDDAGHLMTYLALMAVSACGMAAIFIRMERRRRKSFAGARHSQR